MSLPIRTTLDDVQAICEYLSKKPTGASVAQAKTVLDSRHLDGRKLSALKFWRLIEESEGGKLKITQLGRDAIRESAADRARAMKSIIHSIAPYHAIIERLLHRQEDSISATDAAAHWHQHFTAEVSENDKILNDQAVCFFQIADAASLGKIIVGRKSSPTRFEADFGAIKEFVDQPAEDVSSLDRTLDAMMKADEASSTEQETPKERRQESNSAGKQLGQAIFIAHGKNKKPLNQLKGILDQFKIPYKVAVDEPNLGRPIGEKVRAVMQDCNCAILIFTADEMFTDGEGNEIWRPSENVVFELGASGYLYQHRIVIMKEEGVLFPTNFRDLGHISFAQDALDTKAMDILRELIGFGIVKVST